MRKLTLLALLALPLWGQVAGDDMKRGESATAAFGSGQIEAARGGTGIDTSASTGVARVSTGTWSTDAGISHLAASTSADLAGVLSDETGTGVAVFGTSPTITTSLSQDGDAADAGYLRLQNAAIIGWEAAPAGTDITLTVDASEIMQSSGTFNAATLTEATNAVPNATDNLGFFAATTSAQFAGVISDETGTGLVVLATDPTVEDPFINDVLNFTETAGDATCAAGDYWIKGNSTSTTLRGCENGSLFTLSAGGTNPLSIASPEALTIATGVVTLTGAADTLTYHTIDTEGAAGTDDLSTINCTSGSKHVIYAADDARTVVVKVATGFSQTDFSMDNTADRLLLHCHAANTVKEESRNNNGA